MSEGIQQDGVLELCNETELLDIAWRQGLGHLRRGLPRNELISIVRGEINPQPGHVSPTMETRQLLQNFIEKNWGQIRSQLPACNGKCVTFSCTEGKHALCLYPNKKLLI